MLFIIQLKINQLGDLNLAMNKNGLSNVWKLVAINANGP